MNTYKKDMELMKMNTNERIKTIRLLNQIMKYQEYSERIGLSYRKTAKKGDEHNNVQNKK